MATTTLDDVWALFREVANAQKQVAEAQKAHRLSHSGKLRRSGTIEVIEDHGQRQTIG